MMSEMKLFCAFDDNKAATAIVGDVPMNISCADKTIRASYLCGCATAAPYRGKGIMREMINIYLRRLSGDKIPLSLCIPFDYKALERYGWRTAYMYKQYTLAPEAIPPYTIKGTIEMPVLSRLPISQLSRIYADFTSSKNGYAKRSHEEWKRILSDLVVNFGGSCAIFRDKDNRPTGYMLYLIHGDTMHIYEMAYANRTAAESLYGFARNHSSQISRIIVKAAADDLMQLELCNVKNSAMLCPFVSARITDVAAALAYLCERADGEIKIRVIDRIVEDNNATFSITKNGVLKTDAAPDAVTDIGTLTQLFTGFIGTDEAVAMDMLPGNADAVKCLFEKKSNYINMLIM